MRSHSFSSLLVQQISFIFFMHNAEMSNSLLLGGFGGTLFGSLELTGKLSASQHTFYRRNRMIVRLTSVTNKKVAVYDGAELRAIEHFLSQNDNFIGAKASSRNGNRLVNSVGIMTVVTGTEGAANRRVVGVQVSPLAKSDETLRLDEATQLYLDSVAYIPKSVSDSAAISTYVSSLVSVHCTLPRVKQVGVSTDIWTDVDDFVGGRVVVVGGSNFAIFAARGLAALGADVTLVSTKALSIKNEGLPIEVISPSAGSEGFAAVLGSFDSMLDTISDENETETEKEDESVEESYLAFPLRGKGNSVIELLRMRHKCEAYISTLTKSQRLIRDEGALFGPNKAKDYENKIVNVVQSGAEIRDPIYTYIVPPKGYARHTLQKLFEHGITYSFSGFRGGRGGVFLRSWSFQDFWELASWPRDSAGGGALRFGFPINDDFDVEQLYSRPKINKSDKLVQRQRREDQENSQTEKSEENPYVVQVLGVDGLQSTILSSKNDFLLFLSAPFCRTCKLLSPQYTRMARSFSVARSAVVFAKADVSGSIGKDLGNYLKVDAVPAFVLFRKGQLYGSPIKISKLPSKTLDKALDFLTSGNEWDLDVIRDEN